MKINMKSGIGSLLAAILLVSVMAIPAMSSNNSQAIEKENDIVYTEAELQSLYDKYDITENDLKFAKGELPNFLEGTILCSDKKVVVTEDGKPLENMKQGIDYDIILTEPEMLGIIEKAKKDYIEKYGVDPENPKIDIVNDIAIPTEEVEILVKNYSIELTGSPISSIIEEKMLRVSFNPKAVDDNVYVHIYPAADNNHEPSQSYVSDSIDASGRFEDSGSNVYTVWHYNCWDASDISPTDSSSAALSDLRQDSAYIRDSSNDIVLGWVDYLDNNGRAYIDGPYSVCAVSASGVDWPHDSIVQHEISHNFGALDQGWYVYEHPKCIMNYMWAYSGTNIWCSDCEDDVQYGIDH
ncbi:hypothetical protein C7960_0967 [Methanohalophilus euhalobius]|uniref:Uncharacterized protein n=1 Tax=Methanohalophilus euhalobius TaxID=51203 RepID=A0A285G1F5_9EURY|nr:MULTISPECIES: hypothetical protein [Methanohalophilus]ODV50377.1 MAG: hypothetical protein A8273_381 [Methanohalophilus sp. 2-GBenrich]TCL11779.1 hypothetical protein C7960_0967 [Methanohalophilus euhalobius]SNY16376.1 hypothetical protein SAMN06295989_105127 [Methanohalophilus euhalobius]